MTERLAINFTPAEGAVVRVLGLIERRGYMLRHVAMNENGGTASLVVDVQPLDSSRRVDVVARQLDRLVDVNSVAIVPSNQGSHA